MTQLQTEIVQLKSQIAAQLKQAELEKQAAKDSLDAANTRSTELQTRLDASMEEMQALRVSCWLLSPAPDLPASNLPANLIG